MIYQQYSQTTLMRFRWSHFLFYLQYWILLYCRLIGNFIPYSVNQLPSIHLISLKNMHCRLVSIEVEIDHISTLSLPELPFWMCYVPEASYFYHSICLLLIFCCYLPCLCSDCGISQMSTMIPYGWCPCTNRWEAKSSHPLLIWLMRQMGKKWILKEKMWRDFQC